MPSHTPSEQAKQKLSTNPGGPKRLPGHQDTIAPVPTRDGFGGAMPLMKGTGAGETALVNPKISGINK